MFDLPRRIRSITEKMIKKQIITPRIFVCNFSVSSVVFILFGHS
jgi:hypothetical protein